MITQLRIKRETQGIRQWRLASLAGIGAGKLSLIETGRERANAELRHRLASALGLSVDEVFPEYKEGLK